MDKTIKEITEPKDLKTVIGGVNQDDVNKEMEYSLAQLTLEDLLEKGLISLSEFNEITRLNRKKFKPNLYEIMP